VAIPSTISAAFHPGHGKTEMSKVTLDLACSTPPGWAEHVLKDFNAFLVDHANCERKASALAMSLAVKYSDKVAIIPELIALAQEELEHFRQVYALMEERGLRLEPDSKDPYVNALMAWCRSRGQERFLDRMLVASIVETRGAERFRLIAEALEDEGLRRFYRGLWASEAKHGNLFASLALEYFPPDELYGRLAELVTEEGEIVKDLPWRHSLH
jgi:tRNA-(ms[2]io[6]A)-hydroxylase